MGVCAAYRIDPSEPPPLKRSRRFPPNVVVVVGHTSISSVAALASRRQTIIQSITSYYMAALSSKLRIPRIVIYAIDGHSRNCRYLKGRGISCGEKRLRRPFPDRCNHLSLSFVLPTVGIYIYVYLSSPTIYEHHSLTRYTTTT